ncbi:hypothetical protein ABH931_000642 [Streptacidiphilus sp. MAP12-33]|uniref:hypothetical protein n=1 Tax=Streptacidiphilus sp. MAP12-33 TaxID=3156266 RepID=UPI0035194A50
MTDEVPEEWAARFRQSAKDRAWCDRWVDPAEFVEVALAALLAGVDSPSLALLAGLGHNELAQADELFGQVLEELDLVFPWPADPDEALGALVRWRAREIVQGEVTPVEGADLIWREAAMRFDYPAELRGFVRSLLEWYGANGEPRPRELIEADIVREARRFLEPTPPTAPVPLE